MAKKGFFLGLDVGSVSVNTVVMDEDNQVREEYYTRHLGQPLETARRILSQLLSRLSPSNLEGVAFTGSGGKLLAKILGAYFINEIVAQSRGIESFYPQVRTIIEIGGEDSKLILLDLDSSSRLKVSDFAMNTICAAGTGSFLDQQAHRLGLSIEEFGQLALKSKLPPRIAGRCSVFAKTDMIHLQQLATSDYDIIAGLCFAMARNFKSTIAKGKSFIPPLSFQGGVAANQGMQRAFLKVLELKGEEFIIPQYFASMGAIGAVIVSREEPDFKNNFLGLKPLEEFLLLPPEKRAGPEPLLPSSNSLKKEEKKPFLSSPQKIKAHLGIDVGSISTNVVVIDQQKRVLSKCYLMTAGRPIEAIKQGLKEVGEEIGKRVEILGVGTTGSGRYLTGDFVGADVVRNEITAQATAAIHLNPKVDTIFEIGGQDSKYISIRDGTIVDFEMNKVCAAGTGSFLEEQAEKLGISIKEEFGRLALKAPNPVSLGERCTVFMESDLLHHQQKGAGKEDLVAGLSYSIVLNYLNKVVGDKKIGEEVFFQGGTAFNQGVVAAFEKVLGKKITVPPHHEVTGAIGAAILALEENKSPSSNFKGFDLSHKSYELTSFECPDCPNHCEVKKLEVKGEKPLYYGSRCEKYELDKEKKKRGEELPDLFAQREEMLLNFYSKKVSPRRKATPIGIPRALFFHELLPLWKTFFSELGFPIVLSPKTNKEIIHKGVENMVAETCFPIKVAHGHILSLIEKGIGTIFLPSIINLKPAHPELERSYACPYVQALPYTIHSSIDFKGKGVRLLQPVIHLGRERREIEKELVKLGKELGAGGRKALKAAREALQVQEEFSRALKEKGKEVLSRLKPQDLAMVMVARAYNGCDPGINLNLSQKLKDLGIWAIPMDYLPLEEADLKEEWQEMYWGWGQRILGAAHLIREEPRLYPIYLTNFGCGPDSFIAHFFKEKLKGKPYLTIEIDEHSADVGIVTRLEAFLDSLKNVQEEKVLPFSLRSKASFEVKPEKRKKIYIPYMADHSYVLAATFEYCGVPAEVIPPSDEDTLKWGRKLTSGRECYPCILTTGDMVKIVKGADFDSESSAFFMPSGRGPCRFGQYNRFHRLVLDELGFKQVPIFAPDQDETLYQQVEMVGDDFTRMGWRGVIAVDLLDKKLRETRPYEKKKGESDKVYQFHLNQVCQAIREGKDLVTSLKEAQRDFASLALDKDEKKPIVGIVGEIYIRSNPFSNENIIRELENLGAEVWLPPISEWLLYVNFTSKRYSLTRKRYLNYLKTLLTEKVQKKEEHRLEEVFKHSLKTWPEPPIPEILKLAKPYLHDSFEGEAILSVGKAIDFTRKGASGIISVMPFTCMPGTIVTALLKRYRENYNHIPVLNVAYDGQEQSNNLTRLEAFIYQVRQYQEQREALTRNL